VKQNFNTDDMAHKIARCIEWVSSVHTLLPGDILATGTNHRGLHAFQDGDKIDLGDRAGRQALHQLSATISSEPGAAKPASSAPA
jgi:2-keto-4-pentenoate hydratase/2-oxohepta-3-ene-1,7-dioic acid hydratase in catechol pathway